MVYLNKYREENIDFKENIKEDTKENIEDKVEHIEELPLSEQLALVEQAKGNLEKANEDYQNELEEAIKVLTEKLETAKLIFAEKHYEYETVIATIKKAIVWQEMMK
jgi:MinD-like ATPase involved in chromosome partitioning or flagellar assembly